MMPMNFYAKATLYWLFFSLFRGDYLISVFRLRAEMDTIFSSAPNDSNDINFTTSYLFTTDTNNKDIKRTSELLWQIFGISLLIIGTVGHSLSILTTSASSTLRSHSSGVFIISLSVVGLLTLYSGLLRQVILYSASNYDVRLLSTVGCKIHVFVTYLSLQLFAWLQATIALDRYIAVCFPVHYNKFSKWIYGLGLVGLEVLVVMLLNSGLLVTYGLSNPPFVFCFTSSKEFIKSWPYMDLLNFSIVPAALIIVFNALILINLKKRQSSKLKRHVKSLTIMLMTVNLVFLVSTVPISVLHIIDMRRSIYSNVRLQLAATCTSILQYTGTASTFFIYCLTGTRFRHEIKRIFCRSSLRADWTSGGEAKQRSIQDSGIECSSHGVELNDHSPK